MAANDNRIRPVLSKDVEIAGSFWGKRVNTNRDSSITINLDKPINAPYR